MSQPPRKRISLACTNCNRRKLKCDKTIPCGRCVESGNQKTCTRAGWQSRGQTAFVQEFPGDSQAVNTPNPDESHRGKNPVRKEQRSSNTQDTPLDLDEAANAATILEFLSWGRRKEVSFTTRLAPYADNAEARPPKSSNAEPRIDDDSTLPTHSLQFLLPERCLVEQLVDYHIDCLLWYHGSFHGPMLRRQLADFYDFHGGDISNPNVDSQWVALLFATLAGSIACGNTTTMAEWGFQLREQEVLSNKWSGAVSESLHAAQYMANPSIRSCEAIATLTISAHLLGHSNQQSVLLASAVRIAQSLGLHRLGASSPKIVEREIGRRIWAQLCSQDWFSIPFAECYLINPLYSQSIPPINCDDETLDELPDSTPTRTSYSRYLYSIAALMPQLQDSMISAKTTYFRYQEVLRIDGKMRALASDLRPKYLCNGPLESSWPAWVPWARRAAAISSSHKIIMIHRQMLSASFTNPAYAFTRRTCIAASRTILNEIARITSDDNGEPVLWIYHAFAVAACIILSLDMLHREASDPTCSEYRMLVEEHIEILRESHNSKIADRGVDILSEMLRVEAISRPRNASDRRGGGHGGNGRGSNKGVDITTIVKDLQQRTSPEAHRLGGSPGQDQTNQSLARDRDCTAPSTLSFDIDPDLQSAEQTGGEALQSWELDYLTGEVDVFGSLLNMAQMYSFD